MKPIAHGVPQLDGLRFTAALLVMIAHSTFNAAAIPGPLLNFIWAAAAMGLGLFFVLSGFVIHYGYHETVTLRGGPALFAIARFGRLYPLYFLVLVYEVLASGRVSALVHGTAPDQAVSLLFAGTLTQSWWYGVLGQNNLIFQWGPSTAAAWSISIELVMYMLYPALCLAVHRVQSLRGNLLVIAGICLGQLLCCLLLVRYEEAILNYYQVVFGSVVKEHSATARADDFLQWLESFSFFLRLGQFALGVALANIFIRHRQHRVVVAWMASVRMTPAPVLLATLAYWVVNSFCIYPLVGPWVSYHGIANYLGIFSFFGAALIFAVASFPQAPTARFFGSAVMTGAGDATYATYLLHVPLLLFVNRNVVGLAIAGAPPREAVLRGLCLLLTYVAIVLVGYGVFRTVEAPARRWIRQHCTPAVVYGLLALQFASFVAGVAIVTVIQRAS
jgi:peptidoglycan/LPS O-acetylase OafA/YrhL